MFFVVVVLQYFNVNIFNCSILTYVENVCQAVILFHADPNIMDRKSTNGSFGKICDKITQILFLKIFKRGSGFFSNKMKEG